MLPLQNKTRPLDKNRKDHIHTLSVAPMMKKTDRHFRFFIRFITKETVLYTPMLVSRAILYGDRKRLLDFDPVEKPLVIQLGGDNPDELARCSELAEKWNYNEINLNVGCPSDRVQSGNFGAVLMRKPELVAECIKAMKKACSIPVTIKNRIGIDNFDNYEFLKSFVEITADAGCKHFIVHARSAILKGLSPKKNRVVPALKYEYVYALKEEYPHLQITINGGITNLDDASKHLKYVDGVMIGRAAYNHPFLFTDADSLYYGKKSMQLKRVEIIEKMGRYFEYWEKNGYRPVKILRHMHGLFYGKKGAGVWKKLISRKISKMNSHEIQGHILSTLLENNIQN
jgi:tRNA-dihydrouridine synthase A